MDQIKVVNNNERAVRGRYDGEDFIFEPGKAVVLSLDAAKHIFALGEDDKAGALNKLGFLVPGRDTLEEALAKLDNFTFLEGKTVFDDGEGGEEQEAARAPRKGRAGKSTGGRPHVTGPGGDADEESEGSSSDNLDS